MCVLQKAWSLSHVSQIWHLRACNILHLTVKLKDSSSITHTLRPVCCCSLWLIFAGDLHQVTEAERTAGLSHSLWERLTPGKMHTPTYWPKMSKVTFTKFSVSFLKTWMNTHMSTFKSNDIITITFSVHNVKPECLDAYNELWWVSNNSTIWCCHIIMQVQKILWGVKITHSIPVERLSTLLIP